MAFPIRVSDVMSSPVQTIGPDAPAADAARECVERSIGSLVVVEDGTCRGIVTGTDLVEVLGTKRAPGERPIREIMSAPVVTTSPETPVGEAVVRMAEHDVARLVVLEGSSIVGLVSTDDIVRHVPQVFHRQELTASDEPLPDGRDDVRPEVAYEAPGWEFESVARSQTGLHAGDRVEFTKTISEQDVRSFAAASGDTNRLHLDDRYASQTRFGKRIAHGTLVSGTISAALARLPGLTIYLSQDLSFLAPVDIGQEVTATCEVVGEFGRNKYELTTDVYDSQDEKIIEGEAAVLVDELPGGDEAGTVPEGEH